jgi:aryl-alcohol dehydrogenase-like predicted oxidoreductase
MAMSGAYGESDDPESVATIEAALESGVTLLDTGDFYGMGHNEQLLREALWNCRRERAFVAVKFGAQRGPDGAFLGIDGRPESVKNALSYSLQRLGTDYVDLYQPARVDPDVPIEDTIGAIADLVQAGYVRHIGLSEASADTIRRAHAVHPIAALQIEYSLLSRGVEHTILPTLRELGIALVAYGVLSRGLLGGGVAVRRRAPADGRRHYPRFQGRNLEHNLALVNPLRDVADEKEISVAQLAIAWVLAQGDDIIALVGARSRAQLASGRSAASVKLTAEDLDRIEHAVPVGAAAGERYAAAHMAMLDSELV